MHVEGSQLVDAKGEPIQLKGLSTHGLAWFPQYVNNDFFRQMREDWNCNVVRLAMYTAEYGGYCSGGDQAGLRALIDQGVSYATENDLYVIVDWHILSDNDPRTNEEAAKAFFADVSAAYAQSSNVIYEICNEPNGSTSWEDIKQYAQEIIPVIRENAPDAVIVVGTPTWSQGVEQAAADPLSEFSNIMYALHFYAATHKQDLRSAFERAHAQGLPIFVTEFGICDASGNGAIDETEANAWIAELNEQNTSYVMWNISNKDETSSIISASCDKTSGFSDADLSASGVWFVAMMDGGFSEVAQDPASASASESAQTSPSTGSSNATISSYSPADGAAQLSGTISLANSWESDGKHFYQYDVTLTNDTGSACTSWTAEINLDHAYALHDAWCAGANIAGSTLMLSSVDYNGALASGESVTGIGVIVSE